MPRILHLIKDPARRIALDVVQRQAADPAVSLAVVLMQDAAGLVEPLPGRVYRLGGDGRSRYPAVDHARLLEMIFEADSVVTW
jgi:hypothetical protein